MPHHLFDLHTQERPPLKKLDRFLPGAYSHWQRFVSGSDAPLDEICCQIHPPTCLITVMPLPMISRRAPPDTVVYWEMDKVLAGFFIRQA